MTQSLFSQFPSFIYECLVTKVDYQNGTCSLSPLSPSLSDIIDNVPLPNNFGASNSGIFHGLATGSRVLVVNTSGNGREYVVIVGTLPKESLHKNVFRTGKKPKNTPVRAIPYPELANGRIIVRGGAGNALNLFEDGSIDISSISNKGIFLKKNRLKYYMSVVAETTLGFSNAGKTVKGSVLRAPVVNSNIFPGKDVGEAPIGSDTEFYKKSFEVGFYTGSKTYNRSWGKKKRNPAITEHRTVITEFAEDSKFFGFDKESIRASGISGPTKSLGENPRFKNIGNTLNLAPGELIEIIAGNLVTVDANILDLNYNKVSYGDSNNTVPTQFDSARLERAKRLSRRGIGYHFQLSTASSSSEGNSSQSNFVFDIDKEGVLKVNLPKSSNTGNIPYAGIADFSAGSTPSISFAQESVERPVPVILRDDLGQIVLPDKNSQGIEVRKTGVRFSNTDENPYFAGGSGGSVRVHHTKYHNMYETAERLIGNMIDLVNIPVAFVDDSGITKGIASMKPFEVTYPEEYFSDDEDSILGSGDVESPFPEFMAVAAVVPGPPAIYSGGGVTTSGVYYSEKTSLPCSNSFKIEKDGEEFVAATVDSSGKALKPAGGVSANINSEGALYMSIGSDNIDGKSLMLDMQGSLVGWLGRDNNGRSAILQTDGDFLVNVGGSYVSSGPNIEDQTMNVGRFELRVNIVDKGFVASTFEAAEDDVSEDGANPLGASDIIISLSENGIVIAGSKPGVPMIFRNQDKVLIESAGSNVVLKGNDVQFVDVSGRTKSLKSEGR